MLVALGGMYGYETYVPTYDRQKSFADEPLGELASLKECPKFTYPKIIRKVSTIDVMWFTGDGDALFPYSAFEVELSEGITKDLFRFLELSRAVPHVNLYVVTVASKRQRFARELQQASFAPIQERCRVRETQDLRELYKRAKAHYDVRAQFLGGVPGEAQL